MRYVHLLVLCHGIPPIGRPLAYCGAFGGATWPQVLVDAYPDTLKSPLIKVPSHKYRNGGGLQERQVIPPVTDSALLLPGRARSNEARSTSLALSMARQGH